MAEFNSCASLVENSNYEEIRTLYKKLLSEGKDPYQYMLDLQESLQEQLATRLPETNIRPSEIETSGQLYDWLHNQKVAIDDEFSELISAIPGVSLPEKERTSIWKRWKSNYQEIRNKKVSDLSQTDLLELLFEQIDIKHFILNCELGLKLNAENMFIMYILKNLENARRYNNNY